MKKNKKGGSSLVSACGQPGGICPTITGNGGSLKQITSAGIKKTQLANAKQSASIKAYTGGNRKKKRW